MEEEEEKKKKEDKRKKEKQDRERQHTEDEEEKDDDIKEEDDDQKREVSCVSPYTITIIILICWVCSNPFYWVYRKMKMTMVMMRNVMKMKKRNVIEQQIPKNCRADGTAENL